MNRSICSSNRKCSKQYNNQICNRCSSNDPSLTGPNDGYIFVLNDAGFFIRYSGSYENGGQTFKFSTNAYPVGWHWQVDIPANSSNIQLNVEYLAGDFFWYTLFSTIFNHTDVYCYQTYGTIWSPQIHKIVCESPHLI